MINLYGVENGSTILLDSFVVPELSVSIHELIENLSDDINIDSWNYEDYLIVDHFGNKINIRK